MPDDSKLSAAVRKMLSLYGTKHVLEALIEAYGPDTVGGDEDYVMRLHADLTTALEHYEARYDDINLDDEEEDDGEDEDG